MRFNLILNILGLISRYIGVMFIIPIIVAIWLKEYSDILPFFLSGIISIALGYLLSFNKTAQKDIDNIKKSESLGVVFFAWIFFGLICTIPYLFYGLDFTNASYEAFSGITTTGGTIFKNFDLYSKTLFFYRSLTQWFGGMGIIVLFIAVLPKISVAGRQMFYAEAPAPTEDKATPRIRYTASWLWGIYLAFTLLETIILKFMGVNLYDSLVTSLSTIATGGYSSLSNSIVDFNSTKIAVCVMIFMFISGMNYILIYRSFKKHTIKPIYKNEEFRVYFLIMVSISIFLVLSLFINSHYEIKKAFLTSFFEVITTMTSTGFAIDNYINWDSISKSILFIAFFLGGCATSTSGGIKIIRWIIIWKYLKREINKIIHPQAVYPIKIDGRAIDNDIVSQIIAFIIFYLVIFAIGAFLIVLLEKNTTIALSASASAIGNIGPGFGSIGPMGNFASLTNCTKWILIFLMLIGRLEIIPFLAILNKDLWKN